MIGISANILVVA